MIRERPVIIAIGYHKKLNITSTLDDTEDAYRVSAKSLEPILYAITMKKLLSRWPILVTACTVDGDVVKFYLFITLITLKWLSSRFFLGYKYTLVDIRPVIAQSRVF